MLRHARRDQHRGERGGPWPAGAGRGGSEQPAKSTSGGRGSSWRRRRAAAPRRSCAAPRCPSPASGAGRSGSCAKRCGASNRRSKTPGSSSGRMGAPSGSGGSHDRLGSLERDRLAATPASRALTGLFFVDVFVRPAIWERHFEPIAKEIVQSLTKEELAKFLNKKRLAGSNQYRVRYCVEAAPRVQILDQRWLDLAVAASVYEYVHGRRP